MIKGDIIITQSSQREIKDKNRLKESNRAIKDKEKIIKV